MFKKMVIVVRRSTLWRFSAFALICLAHSLFLRPQSAPNPNPVQPPVSYDQIQRQIQYQNHDNVQNYIETRNQNFSRQSSNSLYYGAQIRSVPPSNHAWTSRNYMPGQTDALRGLKGIERASMLHEAADDKVAQAINHSELARLFLHQNDPEKALFQINAAEPLATATGDHD